MLTNPNLNLENYLQFGEIPGSHGGEYEDDLSSEMLRCVVW
jgi:hypothetical protein